MGDVTQDLMHEHETILYVLKILDKVIETKAVGNSATYEYCNELVNFLQLFADKSHQGKEEHLIKALESTGFVHEGDPLGIIRREHKQCHAFLESMENALESKDVNEFNVAAVQYCTLKEMCIKKESAALFDWADQSLDEETQDELLENFIQLEKSAISRDMYKNMHDMISAWAATFGI